MKRPLTDNGFYQLQERNVIKNCKLSCLGQSLAGNKQTPVLPTQCVSFRTLTIICGFLCGRCDMRSHWLIPGHYSPITPTGRLQAKEPCNKQLVNLERSVFTGKLRGKLERTENNCSLLMSAH